MPLKRHLEGVKMAVRIEERDRIGVEVEAVEEERLRVPSWFGEAVLLGQYWLESGLVGYLEAEVRVERGRMGRYEVADFVLLLNSYAISGEKTLVDFYKALAPVKEVLMRWDRTIVLSQRIKLFFFSYQIIFPVQKVKTITVHEFQR